MGVSEGECGWAVAGGAACAAVGRAGPVNSGGSLGRVLSGGDGEPHVPVPS